MKKPHANSSSSELVFSTSGGRQKSSSQTLLQPSSTNRICKMRLETHGRGGKAVTVIFNFPFRDDEAREIMREMQTKFGCGATFKNQSIELRGDMRDKVASFFADRNFKIVRAGG